MPEIELNRKFLPLIQKHKPIKVVYGGRGSGKSIGFGDIFLTKMTTENADIYCLREFQDSVLDSVHRVFKAAIERYNLEGWEVQENRIIAPTGAQTIYKGAARNPDNIQSAQGYKYSWFEEAHRISQVSLDKLLPTIIRNPGAECWFSGNPQNSSDPFSQRFIMPYMQILNRDGYYEDDLHLIIKINWRDNPWVTKEQEQLRQWDFENLPRAKYDWIWEGAFYDGVDDPLIFPEWFDACIDAHVKLGFEPKGIRFSSFDPSDSGDPKAYAFRHGSVVLDVQEMTTGDANEACDWATGLAINNNSDAFTWDCDGLGVSLNRQVTQAFEGKHTVISQYKGSQAVDFPEVIYEPAEKQPIQNQKKNKEVFKNKRAQYYGVLKDKIYTTYRAVTFNEYHDPDKMISFSSEINCLTQLRSEICTIPIKPNSAGLIELYTKQVMKDKFKLPSPNLADVVKMLGRMPHLTVKPKIIMPQPIKSMGSGVHGTRAGRH
jgi:phage terminase large subunit